MSTNYYYYHHHHCPHCGRNDPPLHVGKSSSGWCFALHVYPDAGLHTLADWVVRWRAGGVIQDQHGDTVAVEDMLSVISERTGDGSNSFAMSDYSVYHNGAIDSEPGPNGLDRRAIDGEHCVGHGDGTWDLCQGDFT